MKIYNEKGKVLITPNKMIDGDIAVIRNWCFPKYIGWILQRYDNKLIALGKISGYSFSTIPESEDCLVEILPKGTLLEI